MTSRTKRCSTASQPAKGGGSRTQSKRMPAPGGEGIWRFRHCQLLNVRAHQGGRGHALTMHRSRRAHMVAWPQRKGGPAEGGDRLSGTENTRLAQPPTAGGALEVRLGGSTGAHLTSREPRT